MIIWLMLIGIRIGAYLDKKNNKNVPNLVVEKACPPHKWAWEDQPGVEPATYFIRCQRCKRLPGFDREQV